MSFDIVILIKRQTNLTSYFVWYYLKLLHNYYIWPIFLFKNKKIITHLFMSIFRVLTIITKKPFYRLYHITYNIGRRFMVFMIMGLNIDHFKFIFTGWSFYRITFSISKIINRFWNFLLENEFKHSSLEYFNVIFFIYLVLPKLWINF